MGAQGPGWISPGPVLSVPSSPSPRAMMRSAAPPKIISGSALPAMLASYHLPNELGDFPRALPPLPPFWYIGPMERAVFSPKKMVSSSVSRPPVNPQRPASLSEKEAAKRIVIGSSEMQFTAPTAQPGMVLSSGRGKPKPSGTESLQYDRTSAAFRLAYPGQSIPDFYDPADKRWPTWVRIWNWVDYYTNRHEGVIAVSAPLRSLGAPFGEGADGDQTWPVRSQEGCKLAYIDAAGGIDGELLARFGAPRPGQGWKNNRIHIGADVVARGGDVVVAPERAVVGSINDFYSGTEAVLLHLENMNTLILGEVSPGSYHEFGIKVGDTVRKGQPVARVGVFQPGQKLEYDMLHVEMWKGHRVLSGNWYAGSARPKDILNPTKYLVDAACPPPQRSRSR